MPKLLISKASRRTVLTAVACLLSSGAALADTSGFDLSTVDQQTALTGAPTQQVAYQPNYIPSPSAFTNNQRLNTLASASRTILSHRSQKLQPTTLDSFVWQAGGMAESIYGDEGTNGPPPMDGMDQSHTIGAGIQSGKLTTNHKSDLPSAWCSYY